DNAEADPPSVSTSAAPLAAATAAITPRIRAGVQPRRRLDRTAWPAWRSLGSTAGEGNSPQSASDFPRSLIAPPLGPARHPSERRSGIPPPTPARLMYKPHA